MLSLFQFNLKGQSEILFSQSFGGAQDETFQDIFITAENEALIIGYGQSNDGLIQSNKGLYDMLVCEMSNAGGVNWSTNIGGSDDDLGKSILNHEDNIFIGGLTYSSDQDITNNKGGGDILFGTLDQEQQFDAVSMLGGNKLDNIVGLKMMLDCSIIVVANTNSTDVTETGVGGATDIYVCRMLANGVILWETKFGSSRVDKANDVIINGQDEIIIVGTTFSDEFLEFRKGTKDGFVMSINNTGEKIWGRRFGNGNYTSFTACDIDAENNILVSGIQGQINNNNSGIRGIYNEDIIAFKLNEDGEQIWQQIQGGKENDFATDIISTNDGGSLIVGHTLSYDNLNNVNFGGHDGFALKLDSDGQKEWSKTYGGSEDDLIHSVRQDGHGHYWLVGQTASSDIHLFENNGGNDAWVLKLKGKVPQLALDLGNPIVVCEGELVNIDASLNNCDCSYTWSDGVEGAAREFTAIESETLSLTVQDELGNVAIDNIRIIVNARPKFELDIQNVSCAGALDGEINANLLSSASTSLTYSWSVNNNAMGPNLSELSPGFYELTVTDENNCFTTESVEISEPNPLELSAEITDALCENLQGEIMLEVSGGTGLYEYEWSSGHSTISLTGVGSGEYQVTVTDSNGCSILENYEIKRKELEFELEFDLTDNLCNGFSLASISILNNTDINTFEWSNGETTASISNLEAGDYTLNYITNDGCSGQQTFTVGEPEMLSVETVVVNNNCGDAREGSISLDISGGVEPYILAWVGGENTTSIENLTSGIYRVTINDNNGCALIIEEQIQAPETIILEDAEIVDSFCSGEDIGSIEIMVAGGTGTLEYNWNTGSTSQSISNLGAGEYQVTVIDEMDCSSIFEFTVEGGSELPEIEVAQNNPLCFGSSDGEIILSQPANISYQWPDGFIGHERNNLSAGDYEITVGNNFGCTKVINIALTEPAELDMSFFLENVSCFGASDGSIQVISTGGTTPYMVSIENSASQIFGLSGDQTLVDLPPGLYFTSLEDANGCELGLPIVLNEPEPILIDASVVDVTCFGDMNGQITTAVTGGTGEYSYFWGGDLTSSSLFDLSGGIFQLEVTDENNCIETNIFQVNEPTLLEALPILTSPSPSSNDGSIGLDLSGGVPPYTVLWAHGEEGALIENLGIGTYEYTIIDANDCLLTGSVLLESTTSTRNKEQISAISLFPNPTNQDVFVDTDIEYRDLQLSLHNALGQQVLGRHYHTFSRGTHRLSVSQLPSGIYYLSLSTPSSEGIYKVVVEHP